MGESDTIISDSMNFYIIVQAGVEVLNTLDVSIDGAALPSPHFEECSELVHVGDLLQAEGPRMPRKDGATTICDR